MDQNDIDSPYTPHLPPSTAAEREAVYAATHDAIKSRDMKKAHQLLLKMIQVDGSNPELWLLLAWTAPRQREAGVYFEHLLQIQPDYPLAICGVAWSGIEWSTGDGSQNVTRQTGELTTTTDTLGKKSLARQTGEFASSVVSFVSKPLKHKPGEIKSPEGVADDPPQVQHAVDMASPVARRGDSAQTRQKGDFTPPAASEENETHPGWAAELNPPVAAVSQPAPHKQAEWLEPAAWSMESETPDYSLLEDGGSAARPRGKPLAAGLSGIGIAAFLGLYLLGITSAELVTTYRSHLLGQAYHGVLLTLILLFAIFNSDSKSQKLLMALGLAPLIRLISLSIPQLNINFMGGYVLTGIVLLIAAVVVYRLAGYKPSQIGLALGQYLPLQLVIGVAGLGLGFIEYLILRPDPLVSSFRLQSIFLPALILFIFPAFIEELIFRGLMQHPSAGTYKKAGLLYISLLFAVLHIGYKSWLDLIFVFIIGLVFSLVVEKTRSLIGVTLAHGLAVISLFLVFPFLLAGPLQNFDLPPAARAQVSGPAIWTAPGSLISRPTEIIAPPTSTATMLPATTELPVELTPSFTPSPFWTLTATWTITPTPTFTATITRFPTLSPTAVRTSTRTPSSRNTLTPTPTRTRTPTAIFTPTMTDLPTSTPTRTPYLSPTPTYTDTPVPTDVLPGEFTETPTPAP
jgi:membrane protease YdiL (CAAX protease family)